MSPYHSSLSLSEAFQQVDIPFRSKSRWVASTAGKFIMIDPLSITGLTISVVDQLLKLGERTAELVDDARAFDDVSWS